MPVHAVPYHAMPCRLFLRDVCLLTGRPTCAVAPGAEARGMDHRKAASGGVDGIVVDGGVRAQAARRRGRAALRVEPREHGFRAQSLGRRA